MYIERIAEILLKSGACSTRWLMWHRGQRCILGMVIQGRCPGCHRVYQAWISWAVSSSGGTPFCVLQGGFWPLCGRGGGSFTPVPSPVEPSLYGEHPQKNEWSVRSHQHPLLWGELGSVITISHDIVISQTQCWDSAVCHCRLLKLRFKLKFWR